MKESLHALIGIYDSNEVDVVDGFYLPLFRCAKRVDRISCYFSAKALATYSRGLEEFAKDPHSKYRLIVSTEISKEDFDAMIEGEKKQKEIDSHLSHNLRETLALDEENHLANLAYLISIGVVELKIAYVRSGRFHYKMGYAENEVGESIFFLGSNNETEAAIKKNYELFTVMDGVGQSYRFENYWNNRVDCVKVSKPSQVIWREIEHYNRGKIIGLCDEDPPSDCIFLDYEKGEITIEMLLSDPPSNYNIIQISKIGRYVESYSDSIIFKKDHNYVDYEQIINSLRNYCEKRDYPFVVSRSLSIFIDKNNLLIKQRRTLGLDIKRKDSKLTDLYQQYKAVVDSLMIRPLRDMQMWDSFFMYSMKKAGNFSVPGSGKTASAFGAYAYLRHVGEVKRLIVIGPLNCFDSWMDEYKSCFGADGIQFYDSRLNAGSVNTQISNLLSTYASKEIFLFNYDSLSKYNSVIREYLVKDSLLIFDEAHYVKGVQSVRSKLSLIISKNFSRTIIMTGTPMPNSYVDLYNPLHILFPSEYDSYFGYTAKLLDNPNESIVEGMNRKLQPFFCRTSKEDLGVPPVNPDIDLNCVACDLEQRLFSKIIERYKDNRLALIVRILQMESDPSMLLDNISDSADYFSDDLADEGNLRSLDLAPSMTDMADPVNEIKISTKTSCCIDLVKKLTSEGKTVIVWCIFLRSIENISSILSSEGISNRIIYGSTALSERTSIIESFKNGDFSVLVTNPHTLAESISLHTVCHDAVYFEYSYNLVHLLQSKDRIHRLGLSSGQYTQYYFMKLDLGLFLKDDSLCGSLDEVIYQRLKDKEEIMKEAIGSGKLEQSTTSVEDIDYIYRKMGWI